ncbi:MAG: hypothetical protein KF774_12090 [Planctomyces sp.]|nr:hypothetical protein [Planctomyces sp.]
MTRFVATLAAVVVFPFAENAVRADAVPAATAASDAAQSARPIDRLTPTHKQVTVIRPRHNNQAVDLQTYCLNADGEILACVSPMTEFSVRGGGKGAKSYVQIYSADGELKVEHPLDFVATAINVSPQGDVYVAGQGQLARLNSDGTVAHRAPTPNIANPEEFKKQAIEDAKRQQEEFTSQFQELIDQAAASLTELEAIPEADRTRQQQAQVKLLQRQKEVYEQQRDAMKLQAEQFFNIESAVQNKSGITALAVTDQDVYVCCQSLKGRGYDVWRTDHEFQNGTVVLTGLLGCCGQMDVQAAGDRLFVAENTKFKVGIYDRDGQPIHSFGSRDRKAEEGFGSCCNPMNVRCCPDGAILAAESSIGNIKRFDADGKLVQLIGKAKIGGGCKHVALGWDAKRDRYYIMHEDKSEICALWSLAEAPEHTEDELLAKAAREGLGEKLVGGWAREGLGPAKKRAGSGNPVSSLLGALFGAGDDASEGFNSEVPFDRVEFHADGRQSVTGGRLSAYGTAWSWSCVKQDGSTLYVAELLEDMEYENVRIEFVNDNEIRVALLYGEAVASTTRYLREGSEQAQEAGEAVAEPAVGEAGAPVETSVVEP